jgi:ABC-type Fe3+ transport system permease subunit
MLLLFILSMRELSTSLFLFTTDTRVLSIVIYEQWIRPLAARGGDEPCL